MKKVISILLLSLLMIGGIKAQGYRIDGVVSSGENALEGVEVLLSERSSFTTSDKEGHFHFDSLYPGAYTLRLFYEGYETKVKRIEIDHANLEVKFQLKTLGKELQTVSIEEEKENDFGIGRLKPVERMAIYAGKKSEVIKADQLNVNKATNNSRQIYSKVPGLNIWESDGAGIQLGIGGRGLNPNRVSNFNTRQNGYDISADALGYPESYYSPPAEAIDRIEIVRGAASLQYGTQFGGFINFKLKEGARNKKLALLSRQTVGSFGLFNSFNSVGGSKNGWQYQTYYQYKRGDGWRPNSGFEVHNAHLNVSKWLSDRLKIGVEYTFMDYLAQQAGGLTDRMFEEDPSQSVRSRNWFAVNWNLMALKLDYKLSARSSLNTRIFGLIAGRDAVGNLSFINRQDLEDTPRDLLKDDYRNWGMEQRYLHRYDLFKQQSIFLLGMRYYRGFTDRFQGEGSSSSKADFSKRGGMDEIDSDYQFPSQNLALFAENIFYLNPKFSVTPGLRYEYIDTRAEGYYVDRSLAINGDILNQEIIPEERENRRDFILAGIGLSFKPNESFELYANFSQNYRSINFNDMRIDNPNYRVDPNLQDEKGFSADLGIRGNKGKFFNYDLSLFMLAYKNRIGNVRITDSVFFRPIRFRTNVSDSRNIGFEGFAEINLLAFFDQIPDHIRLNLFSNLSLMDARYLDSEESAFDGNKVELVAELIYRGGLNLVYKSFELSYLYSYTSEHYTDATNATYTSTAVNGIIPAYMVSDLSAKYQKQHWLFEAGVNNLLDERYFSRRASGYPGPGIIPAEARNFYFTLGLKL